MYHLKTIQDKKELLAELEALETEDLSGFGRKEERKSRKQMRRVSFLYDEDEKNPNYRQRRVKKGKRKSIGEMDNCFPIFVSILLVVYLGLHFILTAIFILEQR